VPLLYVFKTCTGCRPPVAHHRPCRGAFGPAPLRPAGMRRSDGRLRVEAAAALGSSSGFSSSAGRRYIASNSAHAGDFGGPPRLGAQLAHHLVVRVESTAGSYEGPRRAGRGPGGEAQSSAMVSRARRAVRQDVVALGPPSPYPEFPGQVVEAGRGPGGPRRASPGAARRTCAGGRSPRCTGRRLVPGLDQGPGHDAPPGW